MEVTEILKQRGAIYGTYSKGVDVRANIMQWLNIKHLDSQGMYMKMEDQIMFGDVILKIMRAASDPSYIDSWTDLEGYARLIKEAKMKEQENANNH